MRLPPGDTERTVPRQWLPLRSTRTRAPARPSRLEASTTSSSDSAAASTMLKNRTTVFARPSTATSGRHQLNHELLLCAVPSRILHEAGWHVFWGGEREQRVVKSLYL